VSQHPVEVILTKQLASYLAMPIFLVDPQGDLLYYNEPAEALLGRRYDETGELDLAMWSEGFTPTKDDGEPMTREEVPLTIAVTEQRAAHDTFWIVGLDGVKRYLSVTAFPLLAQGGLLLGAVALFWEVDPE
jgi:PAS domain-containing protein